MDLYTFRDLLEEEIRAQSRKPLVIDRKNIRKNNGVCMEALILKEEGSCLAPTIYIGPWYERYLEGMRLPDIGRAIWRSVPRDLREFPMEILEFSDYRKIRDMVYCRMISRDLNAEALQVLCHEEWMDLAITYYCQTFVGEKEGMMVQIEKDHLDMWGITEEELREDAWRNTERDLPPVISSLELVLNELRGCAGDSGDELAPLYILSNKNRCMGAVGIAFPGELEEIYRTVGDNYYILPSSIHECLITPAAIGRPEAELGDMVREVNRAVVELQEVLCDHVYYYDGSTKMLTGCGYS